MSRSRKCSFYINWVGEGAKTYTLFYLHSFHYNQEDMAEVNVSEVFDIAVEDRIGCQQETRYMTR